MIDLVEYLVSLGFHPDRVRGQDYFYRSPLREEKTASFKVNRVKRLYFDHGTGRGGTILDFGMAYFGCDLKAFLEKLASDLSFHRPVKPVLPSLSAQDPHPAPQAGEKNKVQILVAGPLQSPALVDYVASRKIPLPIAAAHCQEVRFELSGRQFFAIGFKNDQGGFELRNPYFKGSSSPKAPTFLNRNHKELSVFEGFFNFLSFLALDQLRPQPSSNFLVLNSLAFFEKSLPVMDQHASITLYLDRDEAGKRCTALALSREQQYQDGSGLYADSKDLNEWLIKNSLALQQEKNSLELARQLQRQQEEFQKQLRQGCNRLRR